MPNQNLILLPKQNKKKRRRNRKTPQVFQINHSRPKKSRMRKLTPGVSLANFVKHYREALSNPFSALADGVRIPDSFRYPSVPYKYTTRVGLTTDATGNLAFTLLPCPYLSLAMNAGTVTGNILQYSVNTNIYSLASPSGSMSAGFGAYRVVAWGARLFLNDTATSARGQYIVTPVPVPANTVLDFNMLNSVIIGTGQVVTDALGLQRPNSGIETSPMACEFNAQQLMYGGDFRFHGVPYSTDCQRFRPLCEPNQNPYASNDFYLNRPSGSIIMASGILPATIQTIGNVNQLDMSGNIALLLTASGLPASTSEVTLEIRYHVEHLSAVGQSSIGVPVSDTPPVGNTALVEKVFNSVQDLLKIGQSPLFKLAVNSMSTAGYQYSRMRYNNRLSLM